MTCADQIICSVSFKGAAYFCKLSQYLIAQGKSSEKLFQRITALHASWHPFLIHSLPDDQKNIQ